MMYPYNTCGKITMSCVYLDCISYFNLTFWPNLYFTVCDSYTSSVDSHCVAWAFVTFKQSKDCMQNKTQYSVIGKRETDWVNVLKFGMNEEKTEVLGSSPALDNLSLFNPEMNNKLTSCNEISKA